MFNTEKIYRTITIIPKNKSQKLLSSLQKNKVCQIKDAENNLAKAEIAEDEQKIINLYSRLEFVRENIEHYSNKATPNIIKELFSGKRKLNPERNSLKKNELFVKLEQCLDIVEENVRSNIKKIKAIEGKKNTNQYLIANLYYLPDMNVSLLKNTDNINKITGIVNNASIEKIKQPIKEKSVMIIKPIDKKISLMIICCLKKYSQEIETFLHETGFDSIAFPYEDLKPMQIVRRLREEDINLLNEENKILKELHRLYISYHPLLNYFHDELKILKEKIDALSLMKSSESFMTLEAWVPEKNMNKFRKIIDDESKGNYTLSHEREDAPTLLNNPKIIKPFESITELYSLPKYKEFDPTPILAITFSFFFGFMLTDFVYGLILLMFGILLIKGKGSYDEKIKNVGIILTSFGFFTLFLGAVFGSYFGDFFQKLGFKVPLLIDSLNQVMIVLIIALAIGTIHLMMGLIAGFAENIKKKKLHDAFLKQGVWIMFVVSIICFIIKATILGYILLAASLLTQIILTFKEAGSISALLSIFNFPGFIGDLFSYGRLMALAMGTAGIALAVNFMAMMVWTAPYIGKPAAILIFIIGHAFNMAMNGLGAFVHSIRLHFLEFFSKFYEGSGKKYIPFGKEVN